jgi:hypothetical protein
MSNKCFADIYSIEYISISEYLIGGTLSENTSLDINHIKKIRSADVLILQVIETDRGHLNNVEVMKYCKPTCSVIKIPHYRNSIYEYKTLEGFPNKNYLINNWDLPNKIRDVNNIDETMKMIENEVAIMNNYPYDVNDMLEKMDFNRNEFSKIDNLSDIKMSDYYNNNYKKYRLFMGRSYPSSRFLFELTNRILIKIGLKPTEKFKDTYFAENTWEPMPDYLYKFGKFSFDNTFYVCTHIKITECEWYYILLLSNDHNICDDKTNIKYLNQIRNIQ